MGAAQDPFAAARRLREDIPDVITLDVEMPQMDGITFLRKLMSQHPLPVVMCSSLTEAGSETLLQAMEAGAVDVILKPKIGVADHLAETADHIRAVVKGAARARVDNPPPLPRRLDVDARAAQPAGEADGGRGPPSPHR